MSSNLNKFLKLSDVLFLDVRRGNIPNTEAIAEISSVLGALADEYRSQDSIPKELAGVMLDMSTALYSAAGNHEGSVRSQLYEQFDFLTDKMRDLCQ